MDPSNSAINLSGEGVMVDFKYFIHSAIQKEISWKSLAFFLTNLITSLDKSKEVIRILVQELETWVTKVEINIETSENSSSIVKQDVEEQDAFEEDVDEYESNELPDLSTVDQPYDEMSGEGLEDAFSENTLETNEQTYLDRSDEDFKNFDSFDCNDEWKTNEIDVKGNLLEDLENCDENQPKVIESKNQEITREAKDVSKHLKIHVKKQKRKPPYPCKYCKMIFTQYAHMQRHERTHTGEQLYKCKACEKSFYRMDHMQKHQRTHTAEKPFECKFCKKSFSQRDKLKRHERIHTGETPYKCSYCEKKFKCPSALKSHKKNHSNE